MVNFITIYIIMISALYVNILCRKPYNKREQEIWRVECELGVISDPECPADGGWAPWGPWSSCKGPCDDIGHRRRTRECVNPPPSKDGIPCNGPDEQTELCYIKNCTVDDFKKLIEGEPARVQALYQLEAVPALMERCLETECPFEAIEAALVNENTWQLNPESLWNALQCVKHNLGCRVMGEWGTWGSWSACGARCGKGVRWRLRRCDTPPPSDALLVCDGLPLQTENCEGDQCAFDDHNSDLSIGGSWSEWGVWSECSEKCGISVRRRRRTCNEKQVPNASGTWGTHCQGQHDELEICYNIHCYLEGGWSGWGPWGPCSQSCGAGKRSRTRSCTRPIPAGGGVNCVGPRTETSSCHIVPCEVYSHTVAVLNGESHIRYYFEHKKVTLFHFYVRFLPLSPHGTLVRHGTVQKPHMRLSLQKWHICLDATGTSKACSLPRLCSMAAVEPAVWHSALITVTSQLATLRLDDAQVPSKGTFLCEPDLMDNYVNITIGERLHGELQEVILNFIPLNMIIERKSRGLLGLYPISASNIVYEKANREEAYLTLDSDQYIRLPCFEKQEEWQLELTIKSNKEAGSILFLSDNTGENWLHLSLQNRRLKLKLSLKEFRSEITSSSDCPPDQWLDVTLSKKKEINIIEANINAGEKMHVVTEEIPKKQQQLRNFKSPYQAITSHNTVYGLTVTTEKELQYKQYYNVVDQMPRSFSLCTDEFYVGGVPMEIQDLRSDNFTPFSGIIASISVNNELLDLYQLSLERYKEGKVQLSSRTASISDSYHETSWGKSNRLNLTCLHARTVRVPHSAVWLFLDTGITAALKDKPVRSIDDGRVLKLIAKADNDLRGFYTCRAHTNRRTRNVITYGVIGKIKHDLNGPDTTTIIAIITTLTLVITTLVWLIIEGMNDLRTGYGFFRDRHLSPEEEAEAVCEFIDTNMHLISSESAARTAKAKARQKGRQLASRLSFAAQEPQGLMQFENQPRNASEDSTHSEIEDLPALPAIKSSSIEPSHDLYRCEPSYVSSPRHGSISSPRAKLTSSSIETSSPRLLCSQLLISKSMHCCRDESLSRKKSNNRFKRTPRKIRSNMLTIKSSTYFHLSPVQKVLQKFQSLRTDDI